MVRSYVALKAVVFFLSSCLKMHNIVGFGMQSFRVSTKTIRLLAQGVHPPHLFSKWVQSANMIKYFICAAIRVRVVWISYTVPKRSKKIETAVHGCYPNLSVSVVLTSRKIFYVVYQLCSLYFIVHSIPKRIFLADRSLADPDCWHSIKVFGFILNVPWLIYYLK